MSHLRVGLGPKVRIAARHREKFLNLLTVALAVLGLLVRLSASLEEPMVDDRSPTAKAMSIVSQITTIGLLAIVPIVIGNWVDNWLVTKPIFILVGLVFGFIAAGFQLMQLVQKLERDRKSKHE